MKPVIKKVFLPITGSRQQGKTGIDQRPGIKMGLKDGKKVATIHATDLDGIRRRWTVVAYQIGGIMKSVHGHSDWGLLFQSHQTPAELKAQEDWLKSKGV